MPTLRFAQRIKIRGVNPYLRVSAKQASALKPGWRKPMPVLVTIDGHPREPARINLMPVGDSSFYLYLNGPIRDASKTAVGDRVVARVAFDTEYRGGPTHAMPPSLKTALRTDLRANEVWRAFPPSRQKEILRYLAALRSDSARERNVEKVLSMLKDARTPFLGRARASPKKKRVRP